jgi:hypothetical protein
MKLIVTWALLLVTSHASSALRNTLRAPIVPTETKLRDIMDSPDSVTKINGQNS